MSAASTKAREVMRTWWPVPAGLLVVVWGARSLAQGGLSSILTLLVLAALAPLLTRPDLMVGAGAFLLFAAQISVASIPGNEVGALLIVAGSLLGRRTTRPLPLRLEALLAMFATWCVVEWIVTESVDGGGRRMLHLALYLAVFACAASGAVPRRPLVVGLASGAVVTSLLAVFAATGYSGRATGLFGDPNAYAYAVSVFAPIVLFECRTTWQRWTTVLASMAFIAASLSRTGIVAWTIGMVCYLLVPRLRTWTILVPAAGVALLWATPAADTAIGVFDARGGSDDLRQRIQQAAEALVVQHPWFGHGLATAKVDLEGNQHFFFHNSYLALVAEVGVLGAAIVLTLLVTSLVHALRDPRAWGAAAGLAAGLAMAAQLGEVLLDQPVALAAGLCWAGGVGMSAAVSRGAGSEATGAAFDVAAQPDVPLGHG